MTVHPYYGSFDNLMVLKQIQIQNLRMRLLLGQPCTIWRAQIHEKKRRLLMKLKGGVLAYHGQVHNKAKIKYVWVEYMSQYQILISLFNKTNNGYIYVTLLIQMLTGIYLYFLLVKITLNSLKLLANNLGWNFKRWIFCCNLVSYMFNYFQYFQLK